MDEENATPLDGFDSDFVNKVAVSLKALVMPIDFAEDVVQKLMMVA